MFIILLAKKNDNDYHYRMINLTARRKTILDFINASNNHWDAEELARALADLGNSIGIATIYRALAALDEAGLINRVEFGGRKRYERADKKHHDHLMCTECGGIEEFVEPGIEVLQEQVASSRSFLMTGHQLMIFGLCKQCADV